MLLPSPKKYSQSFRSHQLTSYASKTIRSILEKMVKAKYISPEDLAFEKVRKLSFELHEAQPETSGTDEDSDEPDQDSPSDQNEIPVENPVRNKSDSIWVVFTCSGTGE